ncbi:MAG: NADH-quinone oxidoreductase subunit L [Deinococcota bacterium]
MIVAIAAFAPLITLIGALTTGLLGKKLKEPWAGIIASSAVGLAFVLACLAFIGLTQTDSVRVPLWSYLQAGGFNLSLGFVLDRLSVLMMLIITGVGLLIHVYSLGYMHGDVNFSRYFAYLNLFVTAMLILVLADSYLLTFVGWEGVGVCSYLLIGFWYGERVNANAARKAFIVNRVGDVGFLLAMFTCVLAFGTLNIAEVGEAAQGLESGSTILTVIGLFFLLAAAGKSAQLPLQVWLPDAMAGPTPVSALIHAATMVTAGVYLVARSGALFAQTPQASAAVAWVGAFTAIIAAATAFTQTDIKKILAYSTVSQLGYMFVGVGVGAYWAGMFHVFTHAFFKALLFLAAGSVIHAMHEEQDVRNMGGLAKHLPITHITALVAVLAISGVPFLAGFFSKDAILASAFNSQLVAGYGSHLLYLVLLGGAVMTAFYMFRWYYLVFQGKERFGIEIRQKLHESPRVMTLPLVILAVMSVLAGYFGLPEFMFTNRFELWLAPVTETTASFAHPPLLVEWILMSLSVMASFGGLGYAYWVYALKAGEPAERWAQTLGQFTKFADEAFGFDQLYARLLTRPAERLAAASSTSDKVVVDGGIRSSLTSVGVLSRVFSVFQSGFVRAYALAILSGVALLIVVVLVAGGGQ